MTDRSSGPRDVNVNWEKKKGKGQPKSGDDAAKLRALSDYQEEQIRADLRLQEGAPQERQGWYDWFVGNPDQFDLEVQKVKAEKDKKGRNLSPKRLKGNLATFHKEGIRQSTYDPKRTQAAQGKLRFAPNQEYQIPKLFNLKDVGHDRAVIERNKLGDGSPKEVYKAVYDEVVKQDKDRNSGWFNRIRHDLHDDDEAPGYTAPRDPALEHVDEYAHRVAAEYLNKGYADEPGIPTGLGEGLTKRDEAALQELWYKRRRQSYAREKQEDYDYAAQAKSEEKAIDTQKKYDDAGIGIFNVFGEKPSYGEEGVGSSSSDYMKDMDYQDEDFGGGRKRKRKQKKKTKKKALKKKHRRKTKRKRRRTRKRKITKKHRGAGKLSRQKTKALKKILKQQQRSLNIIKKALNAQGTFQRQ